MKIFFKLRQNILQKLAVEHIQKKTKTFEGSS